MSVRHLLLASIALTATLSPAQAQTTANLAAAQLLSPFTTLNNSAAGRGALVDNLNATIAINNAASNARQQQAVSDNTSSGNGGQFTSALGTTLNQAYQRAISSNDASISTITSQIGTFTGISGSDSNFNKFYLANGTTNGVTPATGPALPPGGQYNTYDTAYNVSTTTPGQNPYGDSRPFQSRPNQIVMVSPAINATLLTNPSFPSGHTTFGTTVALLEAMAVPERFSQEISRGLDYGYSRVVLGVHYSMDAIAGRILGIHAVADMLNGVDGYAMSNGSNYQSTFTSFATNFRSTLTRYAGTDIATATAGDTTTGIVPGTNYANPADRLTYGIRSTGDTTLAPVVPTGAEVLLATRFPYLSASQRRDVLASTELPSGFALDDGSGWARLDLYRAGMGPAAFNSMATIVQDPSAVASQYQLFAASAASDTWSNDISGSGGFTHLGSGTLTLTGNNSYAGGTTVSGGTLAVTATQLAIGGNYLQTASGVLRLAELGQPVLMSIAGTATLSGLLALDLGAYGNTNGLYQLLAWNGVSGAFSNVQYANLGNGVTTQLDYRSNGLFLRLSGAVPEPSSWMLMIAGFGFTGAALRRARRQPAHA